MRTIRVKEIYDKKGQALFSVLTNAYALELLNVTNFWMGRTEIKTKRSFFDHFYLYYHFRSGLVVYPQNRTREMYNPEKTEAGLNFLSILITQK